MFFLIFYCSPVTSCVFNLSKGGNGHVSNLKYSPKYTNNNINVCQISHIIQTMMKLNILEFQFT